MSKRFAALTALPLLATAAAPAPFDARSLYAGTWQGSGTFYATKYSKAGPASDTTTCAWSGGTAYLVCTQHHESPYGAGEQLTIYTRNGDAYGFQRIEADGSVHTSQIAATATRWTYNGNFEDGSTHVLVRTVNDFPSPGLENWRTEFSVDDGASWTTMADGTDRRAASP